MPLTSKQEDAVDVISAFTNVLLYGGARGGKTWVAVDAGGYICQETEARGLIVRHHAVDVRASIWNITIPAVLRDHGLVLGEDYHMNNTDMTVFFPSGGKLLCAGLDDADRVEKILGQEYCWIYVNESQDVPWESVKKLRTRLSQLVPGVRNRFMADLNPTGTSHWTYRLWFQGVHPETRKPVKFPESYGKIQMSPYDNRQNLAEGYIENELETLVGNSRTRFLIGEYTDTTDLRVFTPKSLFEWHEFEEWSHDRQGALRFVAGLDLGYQDADAFAIFAYVPHEKDVWLVFEHKARRETMDELVTAIRGGMAWIRDNIPARDHSVRIYAETATLRYGHEGDEKKTFSMLHEMYGLPVLRAYKRDKKMGIELLQDVVNSGSFHIPKGGPFHDECEQTIWTRESDGTIVRNIDNESFHPDMMDAVLYPYRELWSYGEDEHRSLPAPEPTKDPPKPNVGEVMFDKFLESTRQDTSWDVW